MSGPEAFQRLKEERRRTQKTLARRLQIWRRKDRVRRWRKKMDVAGDETEPWTQRGRNCTPHSSGQVDELFRAGTGRG
jgi:hypothetical protein